MVGFEIAFEAEFTVRPLHATPARSHLLHQDSLATIAVLQVGAPYSPHQSPSEGADIGFGLFRA